jgi:predicted ABC-type transport system involved in lysophospholipase L1 biosynthesis ATPase subunit
MVAIRLKKVVKEWTTGTAAVRALRGVSLEVERGERLVLLGKSGSGKSTLLHLLAGLDQPTSGRIEVEGAELTRMGEAELANYRLRSVGMIFQSFHLVPWRNAVDNVELPLMFAGASPRDRRIRAEQALEAVGLGHRLTHRPAEMSGGEQQRVAIARALVNRPSLLLADEPTGNLDSDNAAAIVDLLDAHVRQQQATLVLVTHDEELARGFADRILRLRDGDFLTE